MGTSIRKTTASISSSKQNTVRLCFIPNKGELTENHTDTTFDSFSEREAYILGSIIRELYYAQDTSTGILISMRLFSGLTIYQLACGINVNPTNEDWVQRKYNTGEKT